MIKVSIALLILLPQENQLKSYHYRDLGTPKVAMSLYSTIITTLPHGNQGEVDYALIKLQEVKTVYSNTASAIDSLFFLYMLTIVSSIELTMNDATLQPTLVLLNSLTTSPTSQILCFVFVSKVVQYMSCSGCHI